jgi:hypothetical protein
MGGAIGGEQHLGLARAQGVAFDGCGQMSLFGRSEVAQGDGHAGGQASLVEPGGQFGGQFLGQSEPPIDPSGTTAQEFADSSR